MAKNLKLNIKNAQIAEAVNLGSLKEKLSSRKAHPEEPQAHEEPKNVPTVHKEAKETVEERPKEENKRIRARTRSMFAEQRSATHDELAPASTAAEGAVESKRETTKKSIIGELTAAAAGQKQPKSREQLRKEIFGTSEETVAEKRAAAVSSEGATTTTVEAPPSEQAHPVRPARPKPVAAATPPPPQPLEEILPLPKATLDRLLAPKRPQKRFGSSAAAANAAAAQQQQQRLAPPPKFEKKPEREVVPRLGPTGQHIKDLIPPPRPKTYDRNRPAAADRPAQEGRREGAEGRREGPEGRREAPVRERDFDERRPAEGGRRFERRPGPAAGGASQPHQRQRFERPATASTGASTGYHRPGGDRPSGDRPPSERRFADRGDRPARPPHTGAERRFPPASATGDRRFPSTSTAGADRRPATRPFREMPPTAPAEGGDLAGKKTMRSGPPKGPVKEFRDVKPASKKQGDQRTFDTRDRYGLRTDEEQIWRKKRAHKLHMVQEDVTIRPTALKVRLPIALKDLASEMKLKASQLLAKLLMQGIALTLNDQLDDETTIQLLGQEFGCEITIDRAEQERIRITDKSIRDEILASTAEQQQIRAPIVAFMGHVDHGKTSLIDAIRKSNRVAGEAGAITQHIGAFCCTTAVGDLTILDTPGHEAFSAMRARGAHVTDIVVLVVAGDEGVRQQTVEAIQHAKAAAVTIVVALNKCDKPNFNAETVYRQLAEQDLLPEAWGGQTLTVNCSAATGEGVNTLLETLALQAEVLELKANSHMRARGTVLESEMHKGLGAVATILVQNGTLKHGDALVFESFWGRVKTMRDEHGRELRCAGPSTPVSITGLSGLPEAGEEFIVVKNEKEAREIAEARQEGHQQARLLQKRKFSLESLFQQSTTTAKKVLNLVLRADVQGSLEALRTALEKIESAKVLLNIIFAGIGEVSESDVQLAMASKAIVLGYHTQVESHADSLIKELGIQVRLHDIIYHAVDDVKDLMAGLLDKIAQEEQKGRAFVKTTFKSSQFGVIAGCQVMEGTIHRSHKLRLLRQDKAIWQGDISSLRRVKEDVREVTKGVECGIVLSGWNDVKEDDVIESFQIIYLTQQL